MSDVIQIDEPRTESTQALTTQPRVRKREPGPRPPWLKVVYRRNDTFSAVRGIKERLNLVTVCEEARCPNIDECWSAGTATFMLMGDVCTRRCGFCAVGKGTPGPLDVNEPENTARAIAELGVRHAVITTVNRDDLEDGGAEHFASTVRWIRRVSPSTRVELLISDLMGARDDVHRILDAGAHIVAHNTETVPRLYRRVKPKSDYTRTLNVLKWIHEWPDVVSKTGIMVGLGETDEEIEAVMNDLRGVGCEILSLGQYLSPSTKHMAVDRWVSPETFAHFADLGRQMGFRHVESGPLVRSSYMAHRPFADEPS
ncbi:MAG: lipoyl synthase [Myxococcota bacterium]|nr:lipoyl synthase [Myxococcota bacterium]